VATLGILWLTVPLGLLLQPGLWALWSSLGGAAQGGGITFIFTAILTVARDQAAAGRMSAIVQGTGYGVAAIAPTLLGGIHSAAASWTPPLVAVLVAVIAFFAGTGAAVLLAARRR
jgi:CP family cyanate transporter-like MFS transporter